MNAQYPQDKNCMLWVIRSQKALWKEKEAALAESREIERAQYDLEIQKLEGLRVPVWRI